MTHDLVETIHTISEQTHCQWLVAGWDGKYGEGLFIKIPIGLLVTQIDCNFALFKDNGIRYNRKILVALALGKDNPFFIIACDRIARFYNAELVLVRVANNKVPEAEVEQLRRNSETLVADTESSSEVLILQGYNPVKLIAEASAAFDLLVIGVPGEKNRFVVMLGIDKDKFAEKATRSVLRLSIH